MAGGKGTFTVTVQNVGDEPSGEELISADLPDGVTLANVIIPGGNTCVLTTTTTDTLFPLRAVEQGCSLRPLKPQESVTLGFQVDVEAVRDQWTGQHRRRRGEIEADRPDGDNRGRVAGGGH